MTKLLFLCLIFSLLTAFIIIYSYSLNFFPSKWKKKIKQDSLVGLAIIFSSMITGFLWAFYFYFKLFWF
jgi:hypothetical protein